MFQNRALGSLEISGPAGCCRPWAGGSAVGVFRLWLLLDSLCSQDGLKWVILRPQPLKRLDHR